MYAQRMSWAALAMAMGLSGAAQAALQSRLDGLAVYDTNLNLTWLANANLARTNTFGVLINSTGYMTWTTAQSWISAMNAANYLGYNNWRLPTTLQPDASCVSGFNCTGSEMGHLFYSELGGAAYASIWSVHNNSYRLFNNIQAYPYWSGTTYATNPANAWDFWMNDGRQHIDPKAGSLFYAWAVRPGDVALTCTDPTCTAGPITSVPEPEAWGLMLSGLSLVGWVARRRSK